MDGQDEYVRVTPKELSFKFELRKNIPVTLELVNTSLDKVAFKVKTTAPKKYCVRPSSALLEPNSRREVQVIMQAQREAPTSYADCRDKFLVQYAKVDGAAKEPAPEMFDAGRARDLRQTKLRVAIVAPARPPSPVPEGSEGEPASPAGARPRADDIRRRIAAMEAAGGGRPAARAAKAPRGGFGVLSLLLVAIIAFVLGQLAQMHPLVVKKLESLLKVPPKGRW